MSPEGFRKIQASDRLTRGEKFYLNTVIFNIAGSFSTALFEAIARADGLNRAKLAKAFPDETQAYKAWTEGDLHRRASEIAGEACG